MKKDTLAQSIQEGEEGARLAEQQALLREQMKDAMRDLPAQIDSGEFRGALIVTYDPATRKNVLRIWGQRDVVLESAIRFLRQAGILRDS